VSCSPPAQGARQWRELATRKLPEIEAIISDLTELRAVIAACLECGCMDFENCQLLTQPADIPAKQEICILRYQTRATVAQLPCRYSCEADGIIEAVELTSGDHHPLVLAVQ
jgi:hypothetical protein